MSGNKTQSKSLDKQTSNTQQEIQHTRIRVSIRLPQQVAEELMKVYAEPNLSKAIRKAIYDLLRQKGVDVDEILLNPHKRTKQQLPDIEEVF